MAQAKSVDANQVVLCATVTELDAGSEEKLRTYRVAGPAVRQAGALLVD